ncbi:hypothetical protein MPSEU_000780200 [Mayamaea pseudoterrestris]|nr:hypothetical protein MPSEU_000780200 [Mayamaea pseudoterrestris]
MSSMLLSFRASRLLVLSLLGTSATHRVAAAFVVPTVSSALVGSSSFSRSYPSYSTTSRLFSSQEKKAEEPQHTISSDKEQEMSVELSELQAAYQTHQQNAPRLSHAQEVRSLVAYNHGFAVLSTFSKHHSDFPAGGVVAFAPDEQGRPIMVLSNLSTHKQDLKVNSKCSLTVATKEFKGLADARVNLMGTCHVLERETPEHAQAKEFFLAKHPDSFWIEFGDFDVMRMDVEHVRFVGGFARVGSISAADYAKTQPDSIAAFGGHVAKHMNDDHMEATIAMVQANIPGMKDPNNKVTSAVITSVDSLGMYVKVTRESGSELGPQTFKARLPFPRQAKDRGDVKGLIVEMTQASAPAATS